MAANISSGNIGADARNDIAWRKAWVERLTEAEKYFDNINKTVSMPYTLYYSDEIIQGDINYKDETMSLTIKTYLHGSNSINAWALSVERALQAVYDGLEATKRKEAWGLSNWPRQRVTDLNPFTRQSRIFTIVVELVNSGNKVIGRQEFQVGGYWEYNLNRRINVSISVEGRKDVRFTNVKADDITDNLTIRFASVNGETAETAAQKGVLQIRVMQITDSRDGKRYKIVSVGTQMWMGENLNYQTRNSKCYNNNTSYCAKYGRLYNWDDAKNACPVGWHLPNDDEWRTLEDVIGGSSIAGKKLKSTSGWKDNGNGTDDYGWSALSGGYGNVYGIFNNAGNDGYWWSATENDAYNARYRRMYYDFEYVAWNNNYKTYLYSVRCVLGERENQESEPARQEADPETDRKQQADLETDRKQQAEEWFRRGEERRLSGYPVVAFYDMAIQLIPNYVEAYNSRGIAYHINGDFEKAIADYNMVLKLNPNANVQEYLEMAKKKKKLKLKR
jgi:uncharacterized protein (TIGR02145 family)